MPLTPEQIFNIADSLEDLSACRYMVECRTGMSSEIGRIWRLNPVDLAEIPPSAWDDDLIAACNGNRIRFGQLGDGWTQLNIRIGKRLSIYRTNGRTTMVVAVKSLPDA